MSKHIIIGSNGPIGTELYQLLKADNQNVLRFGRSNIIADDYFIGDATKISDLYQASKGASYIYITVGLKYDHKVWQREWPVIIDNVINTAKANNSKIIFFDNVYIYGPELDVPITEEHEIKPSSKKGKVRKKIYEKLTVAMNEVDVLILRAPDFFGPKANSSLIYNAFLENMIKGKTPLFLGNNHKKHSYAYTKDLAKATVLLASDDTSYNQVWHLPCYQTKNIYEILNMYNMILGKNYNLKVIGKKTHKFLGLFMPMLKEIYEMRYQFENDYVFSTDKFFKKYPSFKQLSFEEAIKNTVNSFRE